LPPARFPQAMKRKPNVLVNGGPAQLYM